MTRALSALLLAVAAPSAMAQPHPQRSTERYFGQEEAVADARAFVRLLEASHPDPYTNLGGKVEFKRRAEALIKGIPAGRVPAESLAARLGRFVAALKDGHTRVTLHSEAWRVGTKPLAVRFRIASDAIFLAATDLAELRGTRGYRLVSVNGEPVAALLARLASQLPAENRYDLDRAMVDVLRDEDLVRRLAPQDQPARGVRFGLESPDGHVIERTVESGEAHGTDVLSWREPPVRWAGLERSTEMFYSRFLDNGRTAYLRVAAMGGRERAEAFYWSNIGTKDALRATVARHYEARGLAVPRDLLEGIRALPSVLEVGWALLEEMKRRGTSTLIFDLRGNGGGMTGVIYPLFYAMYGDDYFAQRFPNPSVTVVSQLYMDRYNLTPHDERTRRPEFEVGEYRFSTSDDMPGGSSVTGSPAARAKARREARLTQWRERRHSFLPRIESLDGRPLYRPEKVVVLCDPSTFSAAFQMAFYLQRMGATLVGVPSAQSPNTFMEGTPFVLPISGLSGIISNSTQVFMPETPGADMLPVSFEATYNVHKRYDFDEETILRYALDLLRAGKI